MTTTSQISGLLRDIGERRLERRVGQLRRLARADALAAEAEAAIDRADIGELQEHAVGIAMHQARHRLVRIVADRIVALLGQPVELAPRRAGTGARSDRADRRRRSAPAMAGVIETA